MSGYRALYAGYDQQQNSLQNYSDQGSEQDRRQHTDHQVDSWRSYRNDTTNLQQIANHASAYDYDHATTQQQYASVYQYALNPTASPFQPVGFSSGFHAANSRFTTYQPLRISSGSHERTFVHQARLHSITANTKHGQQLPLRSCRPGISVAAERMFHESPSPGAVPIRRCKSSVPEELSRSSKNDSVGKSRFPARQDSVSPPPVPLPTHEYLAQAHLSPSALETSQRLLVVVDLNGTLLKRQRNRTGFTLRPGVASFMDYLFENHVVMIYTSSRPDNAEAMVKKLLSPKQRQRLAAVWARDMLDLSQAQYESKVQVYKKLEKIWADQGVQQRAGVGRKWDQSNTVLLDDSHLKACAQPYNLLSVEEFINDRPQTGNHRGNPETPEELHAFNTWFTAQLAIVQDLQFKLEHLKYTRDVSQLIRSWQRKAAPIPKRSKSPSIELEQRQLLTPRSPVSHTTEDGESDGGVDLRQNALDYMESPSGQHTVEDKSGVDVSDISDRSVSPIDESVWQEILGGGEKTRDEPPTPNSIDG